MSFANYVTTTERRGMVVGLRQGLLAGIEAMLEVKFKKAGLVLMSQVQPIKDVERLSALLQALRSGESLDAFRSLLSAQPTDSAP